MKTLKCSSGLRAIVVMVGSLGVGLAATSSYTPIDLGTLGGTYSQANAVSVLGSVAGASTTAGDAATHAFVKSVGSGLQDLGTLSGGVNSYAYGVDILGLVVGQSDYNDPVLGLVQHPFLSSKGQMTDLGTLGGAIGQANAISDEGVAVGYSLLSDEATTHAFYYDPIQRKVVDLGTLAGGQNSQAFGINDVGLVAGNSNTGSVDSTGSPVTDAVVWSILKNTVIDLGNLGGSSAQANAVSDFGVAAGSSTTASGQTHAFVTQAGKLVDIGTLGGSYAQGNAISDLGAVVGFSNITGDTDVHAFLWTPAKGMVDLNSLIPAGSGWDLSSAYGINIEGTIVGVGTHNGEAHAFALVLCGK